MEYLAHIDTAIHELIACGFNIGYDKIETACGAWCGRCESLAEVDRTSGSGRRELYAPELIPRHEIAIEPPAQALIEALRTLNIRDRITTTSSFIARLPVRGRTAAASVRTCVLLMFELLIE